MELIKKTNIDFIGMRKVSFIASGIMAIIGILGIIAIARGTANMGIDFSGGTAMQIKFAQPATTQAVRDALGKAGMKEVELQEITGGNQVLLKMHKTTGQSADSVAEALKQGMPSNPFTASVVRRPTLP